MRFGSPLNLTRTLSGFCEYQGYLGGADAFWVSIEFDENIQWFLSVSGSLRWC